MRCEYVTLSDGRQVHYRRAGSGPAMILLHPSPQSSEAIIGAITAFSAVCDCYALDTPGYGLSDDITESHPDMSHYADSVIATADALGMESFYLYGAATGSQIAIELGKRYPDRVKLVMLDSNGHVSDSDRERLMDGYFPDVTPRRDGGHLMTYWDMCRHLFVVFPWQSQRAEDRLGIPLPPAAVTQTMLLRYLQAGSGYAKAYRPAFETESRSHMDGLNVPATMMRWQGSIALAITDALIAQGVPDCMQVLHAEPTVEARFSVQVEALQSAISELGDTGPLHPVANTVSAGKLERRYFGSGDHRVHALANRAGQGAPVILVHDALRSSEQMIGLAEPYIGNRPVMLIDLPGHGASSAIDSEAVSLESLAATIGPAITEFTNEPVDIIGAGLGGAIGLELMKVLQINQIQLIDPIIYTEQERRELIESGLPDMSPQSSGSHLMTAWAMVVDSQFYWPWFNKNPEAARSQNANLDPEYLHQRVCELLQAGPAFESFATLEASIDWPELLKGVAIPVDISSSENHPCADRLSAILN
ncbi:alpha/beta fold hydrolase [Parasphingorhabdus sp.]|uniref:alpha/beta hydrolase n=1 Tax=Parasphingorhabdus sp. TaxID=2709688 RepID=UPI00326477CB